MRFFDIFRPQAAILPAAKVGSGFSRRRSVQLVEFASSSPLPRMPASVKAYDPYDLVPLVRSLVPPLSGDNYKGRHGKIGVVGGCLEYTGAPYFAAMSALRVGADLSYVFCTPSAAATIKGYSPELIVMPYIPEDGEELSSEELEAAARRAVKRVDPWLQRLSCLVVGPGLGTDPLVVATASQILQQARLQGLPLLVDGSGLNIVAKSPELVQGYKKCVLTPNMAELGRLAEGVGVALRGPIGHQWQMQAPPVAAAFQGPVLVSKGQADIICSSSGQKVQCEVGSSPRRAGGQGDVLAGTIAVMMSWAHSNDTVDVAPFDKFVVAAYGGCLLTRAASSAAYNELDRSMVAGDIISHLGKAFKQWLK